MSVFVFGVHLERAGTFDLGPAPSEQTRFLFLFPLSCFSKSPGSPLGAPGPQG